VATIPEALSLARAAAEAQDVARAAQIYQRVLDAVPSEPNALNGLGELAIAAGQLDEAADYIARAIAVAPHEPAFHNNLGEVRRRQVRLEEAATECQRAVELAPNSPLLHSNLGVIRRQQGQVEAAVASFRRALALQEDLPMVHYNLGNAYVKLDELELAVASFRRALEMAPGHPDIHSNLANALHSQTRYAEALAHYEAAIRSRPDFADAHYSRAMTWLTVGDFERGWPEHEWRWQASVAKPLHLTQPHWHGEPLAGRTILLIAEQGLGDTLQFVRYVPIVKSYGGRVILHGAQPLQEILRSVGGIDQFTVGKQCPEHFDCYAPLLTLPAVLNTRLETIPNRVPYVFADEQRVAHWRRQLGGAPGPKVGIAWQGSSGYPDDARRSIPLRYFLPLASGATRLYSLQKNFGREQLTALGEETSIVDLGPQLDEGTGAFVDTAAVMMNLDLVITSDTSMAHLAGSLGVPVWLALHDVPNWRWLTERSDSPWYPTMRLFRQSRRGNWEDVFAQIADEMHKLTAAARLGS
jgi:Flp pilus assembly protein TadD